MPLTCISGANITVGVVFSDRGRSLPLLVAPSTMASSSVARLMRMRFGLPVVPLLRISSAMPSSSTRRVLLALLVYPTRVTGPSAPFGRLSPTIPFSRATCCAPASHSSASPITASSCSSRRSFCRSSAGRKGLRLTMQRFDMRSASNAASRPGRLRSSTPTAAPDATPASVSAASIAVTAACRSFQQNECCSNSSARASGSRAQIA